MIRFNCPSCKKILSAPDDKAGMRFACPGCKNPVAVPSPSSTAVQSRPQMLAESDSGEPKPFAKRALDECLAIGMATFRQTMKPITYFFELFRRSRLRKKTVEKQFVLGQRMCESKVGDPKLRAKIQTLGERITNIQDVRGDAKPAIAERRGLIMQLAGPLMNAPTAPEAVQDEHERARELKSKLQSQEEALAGAMGGLMPPNRVAWRRVGVGYSLVLLAGLGALWVYLGSVAEAARVQELVAAQEEVDRQQQEKDKIWDTKKNMEEVVELCGPSIAALQFSIGQSKAGGTGFMIRPGVLVTNAHVVSSVLADDLSIYYPMAKDPTLAKTAFTGQILFFDAKRDLAFLAVEPKVAPLKIPESFEVKGGSEIYVLGFPGLGKSHFEPHPDKGHLGTRTELEMDEGKEKIPYYQMSITVNPGNSGGPVMDSRGQVIGVVTLKARQERISFCIPWEDLNTRLKAIESEDINTTAALTQSKHRFHVVAQRHIDSADIYLTAYIRYAIAYKLGGPAAARNALESMLREIGDIMLTSKYKAAVPIVLADPHVSPDQRNRLNELIKVHDELKRLTENPSINSLGRVGQLDDQLDDLSKALDLSKDVNFK